MSDKTAVPMSDKKIAYAFLNDHLRGVIPSKEKLEAINGKRLTDQRYQKIVERITETADKTRAKFVDYLNGAGCSTT